MLAGTEYCLTYPYLNLSGQATTQQQQARFNFEAAVYIIKQGPLIDWMGHFPSEEMKTDHVDGYCICKVLVQNSPVLHLQDYAIRPLGACKPGDSPPPVPSDFAAIMGQKLPPALYYLMLHGIISHKLPQALAKGEWTDKSQPLVDTREFRSLLEDLQDYRRVSLGLVAQHLHKSFQNKRILCKAYWEPNIIRTVIGDKIPPNARVLEPAISEGLRWKITKSAVHAEMQRQKVDKVDFRFCLQWHAYEYENDGPLIQGLKDPGPIQYDGELRCLTSLVHFIVLERLDLIDAEEGAPTVLGDVLKDTPSVLTEPCLMALELMKYGTLNGDPFEAPPAIPPESEKPFPVDVQYPELSKLQPDERDRVCCTFLLCRVMSLVPMRLKNVMWDSDVDFDLAAFHALVRILKRSLRQLVEGALANILLKDLSKVKLLPKGFMCASPQKDYPNTPAELPPFMLPRACMGIVVKFFLDYKGPAESFKSDMTKRFQCCAQPMEDLKMALSFWEDITRCVDSIAERLEGIQDLSEQMRKATDNILRPQRERLNL